jgi:hypothetical protein
VFRFSHARLVPGRAWQVSGRDNKQAAVTTNTCTWLPYQYKYVADQIITASLGQLPSSTITCYLYVRVGSERGAARVITGTGHCMGKHAAVGPVCNTQPCSYLLAPDTYVLVCSSMDYKVVMCYGSK